jgi:hypothetical protein
MRKILCILLLATFVQCKKDGVESDIVYTHLQPTQTLTANIGEENPGTLVYSTTSILAGTDVDINKDGFNDYAIYISRTLTDGIYYPKDANYIFIRPIRSFLQESNPFEPLVEVDKSLPVTYAPYVGSGMAKIYQPQDKSMDEFDFRQDYYLYKDDYADSYLRKGNYYIALRMEKDNKHYYGWMELMVEDFSVTVKNFAFCKTPERKIAMGAIQ